MKPPIILRVKKLQRGAAVPTYAHKGDVGMDVKAVSVEYDAENDAYVYHTGFACETEDFCAGFCFPKSRNYKTDAFLSNSVGIVDTKTYRGEVCAIFKNRTSRSMIALGHAMKEHSMLPWYKRLFSNPMKFYPKWEQWLIEHALDFAPYKVGEALFQLVLMEMTPVKIMLTSTLSETTRGTGGFGSTKSKGN